MRAARPAPPSRVQTPTRAEPKSRSSAAAQHLKDAQWSFLQKRFFEAADHCKEALRTDPWNAQAHAMLGDIYRAQGRIDKAVSSYGYALQFNPDDRETEKKLTDLVGKSVYGNRVRGPACSGPAFGWWQATCSAGALALLLILLLGAHPGKPIPWLQQIDTRSLWSWNLTALIAAASATVGIVLSANGILDHPDDELFSKPEPGSR